MIFVFGSNELGIHGRGSANAALGEHDAVFHQGFGPQGNSFAIPTCSKPAYGGHEIPYEKLKYYVECFLLYAREHPELEFKVTQIGCGLAGWLPYQVAPLFREAPDNCYFDSIWIEYLEGKKFWGTYASVS